MAQTFHCRMKIDGATIIGRTSQMSSGGVNRTDGFECVSIEHVDQTPLGGVSSWATGRRRWTPIRVRKIVDAATPLLVDGFVRSKKVDTFECLSFRPAPDGGGSRLHFTIKGTNGRIRSHRIVSDVSAGEARPRAYEEFELVAETMDWSIHGSTVR